MERIKEKFTPKEIYSLRTVIVISLYLKSLYVLLGLYPLELKTLLFSFIAFVPIMFFTAFSFPFKDKTSRRLLLFFHILISILFFADVLYSRGFNRLINYYMIFAKGVSDGMSSSVLSLIRPLDVLLLLDLPILVYYSMKNRVARHRSRPIAFLGMAGITGITIMIGIQQLEYHKVLGDLNSIPLYMSPLGNHVYDLYTHKRENGFKITEEQIAEIEKWNEANQNFLEPSSEYQHLEGIFKGKNLIVIQFESLENFVINKKVWGQEITPNMNRILGESFYFSSLFEQVKDGNSSDAELLFNTSLYPIKRGSAFLRFGENEYNSLPKILERHDYQSMVLHGDDREFWNRHTVFPKLGFHDYIDETGFENQALVGLGILDEYLFEQGFKEMKALKKPFYIKLITVTSHMPFNMPEEYERLNFATKDTSTGYLESIRYVDEEFGKFYDNLKQEGILEDSVIVIYGDHEGVHKYYKTELPDNNRELPFIIHAPGLEGVEIDKPGGQVDMMPTLLYLLGIDQSEYAHTVMGRNLFNNHTGSSMYSTGEIIYADGVKQLEKALYISDITIRSNYYKKHQQQKTN